MKFDADTNYYAILQVDEVATGVVIKAAHDVLREMYWDSPPERSLVDRAYQVLSHPTMRQDYDKFRAGIKGRQDGQNVMVGCPVCLAQNVLRADRSNRNAACGICHAHLSPDLIGRPIRKQAAKNMIAIFRRKYRNLSRQYRSQAVVGLILLVIGGLGTAVFFGFGKGLELPEVELKVKMPEGVQMPVALDAGSPAKPAARAAAPVQVPSVPVTAGQRQADALRALRRDGWRIDAQYDVAGQSGRERIIEASRAGMRMRVYFRSGKAAQIERF